MSNEITRTHKDTLFQMAFKDDPEAALSLYNAVNDSNYTDASLLKFELLDGGLFLRMENDNGFVLDQTLSVYEHQSSLNPNMPLRGLFYFADLYRKIIPEHRRLHWNKLIKIPVPKYVVFYNGPRNMGGDKKILKLSDAFEREDESHGFEWTATMININKGHNEAIMERCKVLREYSYFVDLVRQYGHDMERQDAVIRAMNECISQDIFKDVLERYKEEIKKMSFYEFNEEDFVEMIREDVLEEVKEKIEQEKNRADTEKNRADMAENRLAESVENGMKVLIETVQELGGDKEAAKQKVTEKYPEYENVVDDLLTKYWK